MATDKELRLAAAKVAEKVPASVEIVDRGQVIRSHDGWVFVEAHVQFRLCRLCGDAILPCEACSSLSCSNGLCAAAIHAGCPALREA